MVVARARARQKNYGPRRTLNWIMSKLDLNRPVVRSIYSAWDEWGSSGTRQSINVDARFFYLYLWRIWFLVQKDCQGHTEEISEIASCRHEYP